MPRSIAALARTCGLSLVSQALAAMPLEDPGTAGRPDACHRHLHALVAYLRETAQVEGTRFVVEWQRDGSAVVHRADHSQHLQCIDGELHILFSDPPPSDTVQ